MNILIATNTKFIGIASVMLYSLCQSHENVEVNIYLAYHDLREQDIERLQKIISYFKQKKLFPLDVGGKFAEKVSAKGRFSQEIYYRILVVNLLPQDMERILYLDVDMLIKKDLTEVYETEMNETCPFVVCEDIEGHARGSYEATLDRVAIPHDYKYFNSGFMLMNLNYLRKRNSIGYILDAFCREQYPFPDQDVLNHMYYDKVQFVPWSLYNLPPEWWKVDTEALSRGNIRFASYPDMNNPAINQAARFVDATLQMRDNAYIIHYFGILKPWMYRDRPMYTDLALYADFWFECEREMYEKVRGLECLQ